MTRVGFYDPSTLIMRVDGKFMFDSSVEKKWFNRYGLVDSFPVWTYGETIGDNGIVNLAELYALGYKYTFYEAQVAIQQHELANKTF